MFLASPLLAALLLTAPAVRDHLDFDGDHDGGDVKLDGDRAMVTDGGSLRFYRFTGDRWTPEPMEGVPGGGLIALTGDRAIVATSLKAWSVAFIKGTWQLETALPLPDPGSSAPIRAVALAPGGRRAVVLRDRAVLLTRGPGGFAARQLPVSEPVYGIAVDDDRVALATRSSAIVLEGDDPKPAPKLPLTLDPTPNHIPFVVTGHLVLRGDDLFIGFHTPDFPAYAVVALRRAGGEWVQTDTLRGATPGQGGFFGAAFALSGDRFLVGAPEGSSPGSCSQAFLFERKSQVAWSAPLPLADPSRCTTYGFGGAVALSGRHAAIIATFGGHTSYEGTTLRRGPPRRAYFYDLQGQALPARSERFGVQTDRPGDWAGSLEGSLDIDHHTEQRRSGVRLVVSRTWEGIEASLCTEPGCAYPEIIGRSAEPTEALQITSRKLAELMASRLATDGDTATGTLRRVEDRLVAELTVARTGVAARLELTPTGNRDVDAVLRQRSTTVTSGPPPDVYAGTWFGRGILDNGGDVAVWMRLTAGQTSVKGVWCTGVDESTCKPVTGVSMANGALRFSAPSSPAGQGASAPVLLRLQNDTLNGGLGRGSAPDMPLIFYRSGDRPVAELFARVRASNAERAAEASRGGKCVCVCSCGKKQPDYACPWSECNCRPCPPNVPRRAAGSATAAGPF